MNLAHAPESLAVALPDVPRWFETRAMLLSGDALLTVSQKGDGGVVLDTTFPSGALIGRADRVLLQDVLADVSPDFELVVQMNNLQEAQEALSGWTVRHVIVHSRAHPYGSGERVDPGVVVSVPPQERWLEGSPTTSGSTRRLLKRSRSASWMEPLSPSAPRAA